MSLQLLQQHVTRFANNNFLIKLVISHDGEADLRIRNRISRQSDSIDSATIQSHSLRLPPGKLDTIQVQGSLTHNCREGFLCVEITAQLDDTKEEYSLKTDIQLPAQSFRLSTPVDIIEANKSGRFLLHTSLENCQINADKPPPQVIQHFSRNLTQVEINETAPGAQQQKHNVINVQGMLQKRQQAGELMLLLKDYENKIFILQASISPAKDSQSQHPDTKVLQLHD